MNKLKHNKEKALMTTDVQEYIRDLHTTRLAVGAQGAAGACLFPARS